MDNDIKDKDIVIITIWDKLTVGIFYNNRILTLNHGRININQVKDIMKIGTTDKIQKEVEQIKIKYAKEIDNDKVEITVNDFKTGSVLVDFRGNKWIYLGSGWRLGDGSKNKKSEKSGRMYINMSSINKSISLKDNIDYLLSNCDGNIEKMYDIFKFRVPRIVGVDTKFKYTINDIKDYIHKGCIGIFKNESTYGLIVNFNTNEFEYGYNDVYGVFISGSGRSCSDARPYKDTKSVTRAINI